jgi:hypothetical protein
MNFHLYLLQHENVVLADRILLSNLGVEADFFEGGVHLEPLADPATGVPAQEVVLAAADDSAFAWATASTCNVIVAICFLQNRLTFFFFCTVL